MFNRLKKESPKRDEDKRQPDFKVKMDGKRRTSVFPQQLEELFPPNCAVGMDRVFKGEDLEVLCDGVFIFPVKDGEMDDDS